MITVIVIYFYYHYVVVVVVCVCVYVLCCAVSLVCVCVLSCVSSHILIHVYLCVFTPPPHPPGLCCGEEANVLIQGGIFREKIFLNFGNGVYHVHSQPKSYLVLESRFFHFFRLSKINANRNTNTITGVSTESTATPITTNATNVNIAINQINISFNN